MSIAAEILAGVRDLRVNAESLMVDRCVIRRLAGEITTDPESLEPIPAYDVVYTGRCKLQTYEGHETSRQMAGATQVSQRSTIHLPAGSYLTQPGDIVTITEAWDGLLVGRTFRMVQEYPVKSIATAYRVFVDDNIGSVVPPIEGVP